MGETRPNLWNASRRGQQALLFGRHPVLFGPMESLAYTRVAAATVTVPVP